MLMVGYHSTPNPMRLQRYRLDTIKDVLKKPLIHPSGTEDSSEYLTYETTDYKYVLLIIFTPLLIVFCLILLTSLWFLTLVF